MKSNPGEGTRAPRGASRGGTVVNKHFFGMTSNFFTLLFCLPSITLYLHCINVIFCVSVKLFYVQKNFSKYRKKSNHFATSIRHPYMKGDMIRVSFSLSHTLSHKQKVERHGYIISKFVCSFK